MAATPVLGVLASGEGSTLQAVINACQERLIAGEIGVVISNNSDAGALLRARRAGLATAHISTLTAGGEDARDNAIRDRLLGAGVGLVLLAGYSKKLGDAVLSAFPNRVLNTHPALLPDFGGQGMYGERVHEAVIASGHEQTGITLHLVNAQYDRGGIVAQQRVPVLPDDTPARLAERVKAEEKLFLVEQLRRLTADPSLLDGVSRPPL